MIALGILLVYVALSGVIFAGTAFIDGGPTWRGFAFSFGATAAAFVALSIALGGVALIAAGMG